MTLKFCQDRIYLIINVLSVQWENDYKIRRKKMKCLYCSGEMEKSNISYSIDKKGYHIYLEKIPAYVCSQCGEKYFEEKEVDAIQNMIKSFESKLEEIFIAA